MEHIIPSQIIKEVYTLLLLGFSERKIALKTGVSTGSIHNLLVEFRCSDYDFYLLHTLAVNLHKNGLDTNRYAYLIRVNNILKRLGITEDEFEAILTELPVYCYKSKLRLQEFVNSLRKFKEFGDIHGFDPGVWILAINWYHKQFDYQKQQVCQRLPGNGLQSTENGQCSEFNTLNTELVIVDLLEHMVTDNEVAELNRGHIATLTKTEVLNRILSIVKNPSEYQEVFWNHEKLLKSDSADTKNLSVA